MNRRRLRGRTPPAKLDSSLIDHVISGFPRAAGWRMLRCCEFRLVRKRRRLYPDWTSARAQVGKSAGLYAFLFPKRAFPRPLAFRLHGPTKKNKTRRIPFRVSAIELRSASRGYFAAYIGRSANLYERLSCTSMPRRTRQLHRCVNLSADATSGAQGVRLSSC